jgi:Trk-type K+ transport system membrane component
MLHLKTHVGAQYQKARSLALASIIYIFVGATNFSTYVEINAGRAETRYYEAQFSLFSDLRVWAVLFILAGVVGFVCALKRNFHLGFAALMLMSSWWGSLFAASLVLTGYTRIVPSILTWLLISLFLYLQASWPEYPSEYEVAKKMEEMDES